MQISNRIIKIRKAEGLNQTEFGKLAGVGITAQVNYEKGLRVPDLNYLINLSKNNIDIIYLLTGKREIGNELSIEETFLVQKFREADKNKQNIALGLLMMDENNLLKAAAGDLSKGSKVTVGDDNSGNVAGSDIKT